jgi:hypothetical protein
MSRPQTTALVLAFAGLALVLPTVAAPPTGQATDPVSPNVTVTTENSANADYVTITEAGTLALDLSSSNPALTADGINPNAVTYVADAFRIRYDGDRYARVWLTTDAEGIEFRARGESLGSRTDAIRLDPDESVVVDTTEDNPPERAAFSVEGRVADPEDVGSADTDAAGLAADDATEAPSIRVESPDARGRTVTIENAVAGRPSTVAMDRLVIDREGDGAITLDELSVAGSSPLEMDVAVTEPDAAGSLPADASARPLGAIRVEERRGTVDRATFRFAVDRAYLAATGIDPTDLTVYRYDGTEWSERGAEVVGRSGGDIFLETETPGFSTFVIAAEVPGIRVETAELDAAAVAPDERATVTATVTNDGRVAGERTVALTLDGEVLGERRVALAPGESADVTFRVRAPTGTYAIRVGGVDDGRLVVEGAEQEGGDGGTPTAADGAGNVTTRTPTAVADTPAAATGSPVAEPAGGSLPATVAFVAGLLAVLALVALVRRVRR